MFEVTALSDAELVERLRIAERVIATANAEQIAVIAELHARAPKWLTTTDPGCPRVHPIEVTAAEVGPALRISRVSATDRVDLAVTVASRQRATLGSLGAGAISLTKVRQMVEATAALTDEAAAEVEARVLPRAGDQTPGSFGVTLARAVIACDPAAAEARRRQAVRERRVDVFPGRDGMATFRALLPAAQALAAYRSVSDAAGRAEVPGDARTADARRADTLAEVLIHLGATATIQWPTAVTQQPAALPHHSPDPQPDPATQPPDRPDPQRGRTARPRWRSGALAVHVTVPLTSLIGCDQQPGI
ncbi:MAG: DUF222 domain-containing protein [Geodermatophilaceae bacterium]